MNELFPIFIKANKINILLIGAGKVAEDKLYFLLKSSPRANVRIIAIKSTQKINEIVNKNGNINIEKREFLDGDIIGNHIVIAATNNPNLNKHIKKLSDEKCILVNIADKSEQCDFYLGGIVTKGDLKIAISTNGKSPIIAKRLRQFFEKELSNSLKSVIENTEILRKKMRGSFDKKLFELNRMTRNLIENEESKEEKEQSRQNYQNRFKIKFK